MPISWRPAGWLLLACLMPLFAVPAAAQFPDKPLRLIIPYTPGGTNDIIGRLVTEGMSRRLGQPFVIENRGGAGGMLGSDLVAKAAPDGYTILLGGSGSLTIVSLVHRAVPFDVTKDFAPIGLIGAGPNVIVVRPDLPVRSLRELQDYARRNPTSFASPGVGSTGHAAGVMILQALGVQMDHIPYRGTSPAMTDVMAGRVDVFTNALAPMEPFIKEGRLRPLAIAGARRTPAMPELPTTAEAGFPQILAATWFGLLAPGGTPPDRVARLHAALNATLAEPEVQRRLAEGGVEMEVTESPAAFAHYFAEDRRRWAGVIDRAGMRGAQ